MFTRALPGYLLCFLAYLSFLIVPQELGNEVCFIIEMDFLFSFLCVHSIVIIV